MNSSGTLSTKSALGKTRRRGREVAGGVPRCHARETGIQEHRASYRFLSHQSKSTSSIRMLGTPLEGVTGYNPSAPRQSDGASRGIVHRVCLERERGGGKRSKKALNASTNHDYAGYVIVLAAPAKLQDVAQQCVLQPVGR